MKGALYPKRFFVVIPCHNCEQFIGECLDSLKGQTFTDWTALVADDASTDGTADVVREFAKADPRIQLKVGGERAWLMGNTLNALRSLDLEPGDVVAILDGDDWIRPTCLEKIREAHCQGFDLVYTDEDIQGQEHSIGGVLIASAPVRRQAWCFSQLRSFKAYLFLLLDDDVFRDRHGNYFRAAGDLALYLPMAALAGPEKVRFIPEKLYYYRVHQNCNFKVFRQEQLSNNRDIRRRPPMERQTLYFDFAEPVRNLEKSAIHELSRRVRAGHPRPYTVKVEHVVQPEEKDSWRAYHELWIEEGVYLAGVVERGHD